MEGTGKLTPPSRLNQEIPTDGAEWGHTSGEKKTQASSRVQQHALKAALAVMRDSREEESEEDVQPQQRPDVAAFSNVPGSTPGKHGTHFTPSRGKTRKSWPKSQDAVQERRQAVERKAKKKL